MIGNYYFCPVMPVLGFFQIKHVNVSRTVSKLKVGVDIHNYLRMYKLIFLIRISKFFYEQEKIDAKIIWEQEFQIMRNIH